jgi:hypothetical protein
MNIVTLVFDDGSRIDVELDNLTSYEEIEKISNGRNYHVEIDGRKYNDMMVEFFYDEFGEKWFDFKGFIAYKNAVETFGNKKLVIAAVKLNIPLEEIDDRYYGYFETDKELAANYLYREEKITDEGQMKEMPFCFLDVKKLATHIFYVEDLAEYNGFHFNVKGLTHE